MKSRYVSASRATCPRSHLSENNPHLPCDCVRLVWKPSHSSCHRTLMGNTQPRAPQYLGWGFAGLHWIELLPLSSPPSLFFTGADPNKYLAPQIPSQYLWQRTQPVTVGYEELEGPHRWGGRGGVHLWQTKETQYGSSGKLKWHFNNLGQLRV